jgi:hypothetical protein
MAKLHYSAPVAHGPGVENRICISLKVKEQPQRQERAKQSRIYSPYPKAFVSERGWWYTRWARWCFAVCETCVCMCVVVGWWMVSSGW